MLSRNGGILNHPAGRLSRRMSVLSIIPQNTSASVSIREGGGLIHKESENRMDNVYIGKKIFGESMTFLNNSIISAVKDVKI